MTDKLTDSIVKKLAPPPKGNRITYDSDVKGFGARVTSAGARAFIFNYRTRSGRERRFTIGSFPAWNTVAARAEAKSLRQRIDQGGDPLADIESARQAETVADLAKQFEKEHIPKKRPSTQRDYKAIIARHVLPAWKHRKIAEITTDDVAALHRKISVGAPYAANRTVAVVSAMFKNSTRRTDNPAKGIERNPEEQRERYLSAEEMLRLSAALDQHPNRQAVNAILLAISDRCAGGRGDGGAVVGVRPRGGNVEEALGAHETEEDAPNSLERARPSVAFTDGRGCDGGLCLPRSRHRPHGSFEQGLGNHPEGRQDRGRAAP